MLVSEEDIISEYYPELKDITTRLKYYKQLKEK